MPQMRGGTWCLHTQTKGYVDEKRPTTAVIVGEVVAETNISTLFTSEFNSGHYDTLLLLEGKEKLSYV
jgi:hypothetical protein